MPTKLLYLADAYQQTATARVTKIEQGNKQSSIYLDQTLFYPQGGGQPADQGVISGKKGKFTVSHVSYNSGEIQHKGSLTGHLEIGEAVTLQLDWPTRYQHMQWHTAGHIVDLAVQTVIPGIFGVNGEHGITNKLYIEYTQPIPVETLSAIQDVVDQIVSATLPIQTEMVTPEELKNRQINIPFDLPTNKPLRLVQIGQYPAMPDGGTHLKTTNESWPITVTTTKVKDGRSQVHYQVYNPEETLPMNQAVHSIKTPSNATITLTQLTHQLASIKAQFETAQSSSEELHIKYLGKKGIFNDLAKQIKQIPTDDRKAAGQALNELKTWLETKIANYSSQTTTREWLDVTLPGIKPKVGHLHPVTQAMEEITTIFQKIGFTRVRYPEVDWDWYVFEALNMPPSHPARDEWETFFVDAPTNPENGNMVLTTHTSNGQVREMERLNHQPPIRMINIARCYRRQQDATHTQMFHQFEGLVVDKGINIQHLKGTLDYFAQEFYGPGTKSRIRPFHFQFTEPSFEVDFSCHICLGTGSVKNESGEKVKCRFCKSGWHEVGGAGMVHPNVLKAGGIDPEEYTGFAFGWGVERTYSLKEGLQIDDIRLLYSGELGFLEQF